MMSLYYPAKYCDDNDQKGGKNYNVAIPCNPSHTTQDTYPYISPTN